MTCKTVFMMAGLGNPGEKYTGTRHNIGFLVLDKLAAMFSLSLEKSRFDALYTRDRIDGSALILAKPLSYMNRSGFPLQRLSSYYKVPLENIIVIHDDLDLEFGKIKIVKKRGHGGHNGIRSIVEAFGSNDFIRVRVGVGRPLGATDAAGYVLGRFSKSEAGHLDEIITTSARAAEMVVKQGVSSAMNCYNQN
ncbi:MAG: aminoacyl-tRNA hydrolase [Thermodesulfobacteriota bacterium]|nr:aminoacyl-tRNA hydrolase [Thermodesulfobacteriota bacterium]